MRVFHKTTAHWASSQTHYIFIKLLVPCFSFVYGVKIIWKCFVHNRERAQSLHSFKGQRTREKRAYQYYFFSVASKFTANHAKTLHSNERFAGKLNLEKWNPTLKCVLDLTFVCRASCIDCTSTKPHLSIPKTRARITSGRGGKKNTSRRRRGRGGQARKKVHKKNNPELQTWWNNSEEKSREEEEEDNDNDDDDDADDDDNNDLVFFFLLVNIQPTSPYQTASTPWQPEAGR